MNLEVEVNAIVADNISGSTRILENTITVFKDYLKQNNYHLDRLREQVDVLLNKSGEFAVVQHFLKKFRNRIGEVEKELSENNSLAGKKLLEYIDEYERKWKSPLIELARHMSSDIDFSEKTLLLHSNSSSLHRVFHYLSSRNIFPVIYQTLSGPANEGKDQAKVLANMGFKVHFIHESATGIFAPQVDMMLLGADKIFKDHFVNKIGSLSIALLAKFTGKPLYVLSDSRKMINRELDENSLQFTGSERPSEELWEKPPLNIELLNYYFEKVPNVLVDKFYFEFGSVRGSRMND